MFARKTVEVFELSRFLSEFSVLLDSGIPILRILDILVDSPWSRPLQQSVEQLQRSVQSGWPISRFMAAHPQTFPAFLVAMLRAGELNGALAQNLRKGAETLGATDRRQRRIRAALSYPLFVVSFTLLCLAGIGHVILPSYLEMCGQLLPASSPLLHLLRLANLLLNPWLWAALLPGLLLGFRHLLKILLRPTHQLRRDRLLLQLPVLGRLLKVYASAQICDLMRQLLSSGSDLLGILRLVREAQSNRAVAEALGRIESNVRLGEPLSEAFEREQAYFPSLMVSFLAAGEESASLDGMLGSAYTILADELENSLAAFSALLEPLLMVLVGGIVGCAVILLFLPMVVAIGNI